jgi:acetoin utilization protein AcuB
MSKSPTVGDYMSPDVFSANASDSLRSITVIVQIRKIRHIPVVDDDGKLVGIVTDRDLKRALPSPLSPSAAGEYDEIVDTTSVDRVMTREPFTVASGASLIESTREMAERKVGGLPVVNGDELVGMFTTSDAVRALLEMVDEA